MEIFWTEERTALVRAHREDGISASQSATVLGTTRNAVIGKWGRMKLPPRKPVAPPKPHQPRPRMSNRTLAFAGMLSADRAAPEPYHSTLSADAIPRQQRKTVATLAERHCRFPYGDPCGADFFFCGAVRTGADLPIDRGGLPYCAVHCRIAYGGQGRSLEGLKVA